MLPTSNISPSITVSFVTRNLSTSIGCLLLIVNVLLSPSLCFNDCFMLVEAAMSTRRTTTVETEARLQGYKERGYEWPVPKFVPDTPGWRKLIEDRLEQVAEISDPAERFKGYTATMYSGLIIQNYTEYGFARTRISDSLLEELQQGIRDGMNNRRNEGYTPSITGPQAMHIERDDLMTKVEYELHNKLEEWSDTDLDLSVIYGLRLFQKETAMKMHLDRKGSHSLGYILHVDSSDDYSENEDPWPFLIEDFHGRTHEILMSPGDVILFEATKLLHGRPHKLNASWYCNIIGHYHPRDKSWSSFNHLEEAEFAVPPHWTKQPKRTEQSIDNKMKPERLEFRGGLNEPDCINGWCHSTGEDIIDWKGPVESSNHWIDAKGDIHEFVGRRKSKGEALEL